MFIAMILSPLNLAVFSSLVACTLGDQNDWVNVEYTLAQARSRFAGSSSTADAQTYIIREAEVWARKGPWTIVDESGNLAPSGDANDFLSWAPYHWPNCDWCSPSHSTYQAHAAVSYLNNSQSPDADNSILAQSNVGYEGVQSILAVPMSAGESRAGPAVTPVSSRNLGLSKRQATVNLPTALPLSSVIDLDPTSTTSASVRRTPGPAQAAAKTTKTSCTPSPTKTLQPSATWTTCPYIGRDGATNPDTRTLKAPEAMNSASQAAIYNAVAFALQKASSYSKNAADIIETFFLTQATRMNPNLQFGQVIRGPGQNGRIGTFTGILDLRGLVKIVNSIFILRAAGSPDWDTTRHNAMLSWASEYSQWLTTSDIAKGAASRPNNHATFHASQLAAASYLLGDREGAIKILQDFCSTTFIDQIAKSGEQPFEAIRTRPYHYRCFNVEALITNAKLGDELGINLWNCRSRYGATIQTAVDFLMSTNPGDEDPSLLFPHVAAVAGAYGDPQGKYAAFLKEKASSYTSKPFWFYDQPAAFPNAPPLKKKTMATLWKREDSLTVRDSGLAQSPVEVEFECPDVFKSAWKVEIEDDLFTTCDELRGFYEYMPAGTGT